MQIARMQLQRLDAVIDRRLLVNYRVDPEVAAALLPAPLRVQLVNGYALAGICMLAMSQVRPAGLPGALGRSSESAAHRIAVEWDTPRGVESGVYIPRRDTSSAITSLLGGQVFPGSHHRASFDVHAHRDRLRVGFQSVDSSVSADVSVELAEELEGSALFSSVEEATSLLACSSVGYSPRGSGALEGVRIVPEAWELHPCTVITSHSSVLEDVTLFPTGSTVVDSALLMRDTPVRLERVAGMRAGRARALLL